MQSDHGYSPASANGRVADLDGVRAIAIWTVMLMHVYYAFPIAQERCRLSPNR